MSVPLSRGLSKRAQRALSVPEKIQVQLLKDHPTLGQRGQIVRVRPAYMRNFLHVDNKACYITADLGPRIPVVERDLAREAEKRAAAAEALKQQKQKEERKLKEAAEVANGAMSLEELSSLFGNMQSRRGQRTAETVSFAAESAQEMAGYSVSELNEAIPRVYTVVLGKNTQLPVTKNFLASAISASSGIAVPVSAMRLNSGSEEVSEAAAAGDYQWTLVVPGESTNVKRTLRVQEE